MWIWWDELQFHSRTCIHISTLTQIHRHRYRRTHIYSNIITYQYTYICSNIVKKVKLATVVEGDPKASFSIATPFPGLLHFTINPYLRMVSVKQGGIKNHYWVFSMIWPGIEPIYIYICMYVCMYIYIFEYIYIYIYI